MDDKTSGQDPLADDRRIDRIGDRLREIEQREAAEEARKRGHGVDANYRMGSRVLADLVAGIAGGSLFGWLFDSWFGTSPWLLLAFLFLGTIVAFRNIIRLSNAQSAAHAPDKEAGEADKGGAEQD